MVTREEFLSALRGVDSATVANAIEGLDVRDPTEGYADVRLRYLVAQAAPMVGSAVTVRVDSTTPHRTPDRSGLAMVRDAVLASEQPAVVVFEEAGPSPQRGCHVGDVIGTMLAHHGVVGVVSGSGIRDLDGLHALGLSAFAMGTVVSRGVLTITDVGMDVEVAGLHVRNGELLHGDVHGLVTVPSDRPERLLQLIDHVLAQEADQKRMFCALTNP